MLYLLAWNNLDRTFGEGYDVDPQINDQKHTNLIHHSKNIAAINQYINNLMVTMLAKELSLPKFHIDQKSAQPGLKSFKMLIMNYPCSGAIIQHELEILKSALKGKKHFENKTNYKGISDFSLHNFKKSRLNAYIHKH